MDESLEALWASYGLLPGDSDDFPMLPDSPDCADLLSDDALDPADLLNLTDPEPLVSYISVCTTGTQTLEDAKAEDKPTKSEQKYQCHVCGILVANSSAMRLHLWKTHNMGRSYRCGQCDYASLNKFHVIDHVAAMHSRTPDDLRCPKCDKRFKKKTGLMTHLKLRDHDPPHVIWKCGLCRAETKSRELLRKHLSNVHGKKMNGADVERALSCAHCDFRAKKSDELRSHLHRCHPRVAQVARNAAQPKPFKCPVCPYMASERRDLEKHERQHNGEKPFACECCPYRSVTRSGVLRHQRSHAQVKPHVCPECGQSYADKKRLNDHLLKHEGIKPFACGICGADFRRRDNLKMHILRRHRDLEPTDSQVKLASSA